MRSRQVEFELPTSAAFIFLVNSRGEAYGHQYQYWVPSQMGGTDVAIWPETETYSGEVPRFPWTHPP